MQTEHLMVTGMTCGGCTIKVSRALNAVSGVDDANVSLSPMIAGARHELRFSVLDHKRIETTKEAPWITASPLK